MIKLKSLLNESYANDESILYGRIISGGSDKARDIISKMTNGNSSTIGNLSNMSNWLGQYKDGLEFALKN